MTLFKSITARDIWVGHWCERCWREPNECKILTNALTSDRKPREWNRNPRAQLMKDAYRCNAFDTRPPRIDQHGAPAYDDVPMFDVEPQDISYVPVAEWPDQPRKKEEGDHA